jgi:hypothetical protein
MRIYCRTRQFDEPFITYPVEHVIARQHGGTDDEENLALACPQCNLHKGPNLAGIDPENGVLESLSHPRRHSWDEHFESRGARIVGRTSVGRTTIRVLSMNDSARVELRSEAGAP